MKIILFIGLFAIVLASAAKVKLLKQPPLKPSTKEMLSMQKAILNLFQNINQPNYYTEQVNIAEFYDIEDNIENYSSPEAIREFMDLNRLGFLPKDEIFSIFNEKHRREAISLFKILYYANDYYTLYRTACWARVFMNEGMFVYSLSVALVQRPDTAMFNLPPIYEIYPEYFYNSEVIQNAKNARKLYKNMPMQSIYDQKMKMEQKPIPEMFPQYPGQQEYPRKTMNKELEDPRLQQFEQPQMLPIWRNLLPESLRTQQEWFEQWRQEPLTPEQFRLEQLRQEQLRLEQMRLEQLRQEQLKQKEMQEDQFRKDQEGEGMNDETQFTGITIDANYSKSQNKENKESLMSYFTEDIGLNAYYYYYNIYFPFWLSNDMINLQTERRGEQFYYMLQQLLARYYLERLSNGLGDIPMLEYLIPIRTGYYPSMAYPNGMKFPERRDNLWITMHRAMQNTHVSDNYTNSYTFVRDYERRIRDAIDLGYVTTSKGKQISLYDEKGFEMLGNMIEGNPTSPNARFYGCLQIFARLLLGNSEMPNKNYKIAPSALEQFETSLRDPIFFQFCKRMIMYFQKYLNNVSPYTIKDLLMPGVKVQDVQVDKLTTYFDDFYVDITNAVYNRQSELNVEQVPIRVRQMRLNCKPFNYMLNVMSDRPYQALIKVFLGPKYDETKQRLDISRNRLNFVEIDKFTTVLNPGVNYLRRNSHDNFYSNDRTTYRQMYMSVMMNINTPDIPAYELREPERGMPKRLLLPKGSKEGQMYKMYFIITPQPPMKVKLSKDNLEMPQMSWRKLDSYPLGYPFDRPIDESVFYVPNSFFKDVMIYNMEMKDMEI